MRSYGGPKQVILVPRFRSPTSTGMPMPKRLIEALKSSVSVPVSLHICGNPTSILADMASSGADVLELDHPVNIREASRTIGPDIAIWGNIDPVGVLSQGTVDDVHRATRELLQIVDECGHDRFVLSSGCTLAVETPPENLRMMFKTAREPRGTRPHKPTADGAIEHV